jgi:hypothetical protein
VVSDLQTSESLLKQLTYSLSFILVLLFSYHTTANESLMVITENWPPMSYRINDKPTVYAVELIQTLQLQLSQTDPIVFLP